jgi:hypothetical protein
MTFALKEPGGLRIGGCRVRCQTWLDMGEQMKERALQVAASSK